MERRNLRIIQGEDFSISFPMPGLSPTVLVVAEIRRWAGGPLLARFESQANAGSGTLTLKLNDLQTRDLKRHGVYDLQVIDGDNTVFHYFGIVTVIPRVSTEPTTAPIGHLPWLDMTQTWLQLPETLTWETI